jgi:hypothetical protein
MNALWPLWFGIASGMILIFAGSTAWLIHEIRQAPLIELRHRDTPPTLGTLTDCEWCADLYTDDITACDCTTRCPGIRWCRGLIPAGDAS